MTRAPLDSLVPRLVITVTLFSIGCAKERISAKPDAGATSASRVSSIPPPPSGPCATDADCSVYLEPCSCGCIAHVGAPSLIPNDKWMTVCGGGPPGNCGVASPCANLKATCVGATKTCAIVR